MEKNVEEITEVFKLTTRKSKCETRSLVSILVIF